MKNRLKKILIKSKKESFSELLGDNSSKIKGEGYDFCELKEYEYGDDIKNIDWLISAKMQKPYEKVYYEQKELNINIISILTGSMHFGLEEFKQEIACEVASILAFSAIKQGDSFSSFIANENLELCTKKSKREFNVNLMAQKLLEYNCINKSINYNICTKEILKQIKRKSMLFIIGDFFDFKEFNLKLLSKKHEIYLIIIRDKFEEDLASLGNVNFKDLENGFNYEGYLDNFTVKNYQKAIKENDHKLYEYLQENAIKFTKIYTNENIIAKLIRLFK